jgi:dCMP deaminase
VSLAKDDQYFIELAELAAKRSPDVKRQVGAVVVKDGRKVSDGHNKPVPNKQITDYFCQSKQLYMIHAEMDALLKATSKKCKNATIYITLAPCPECCKLIAAREIKKVVYMEDHKDANVNYLRELGITVDKYVDIFKEYDKIKPLQE